MTLFRRSPKEYRVVQDGRGGQRFPWTVYGPGGAGEPLSIHDVISLDLPPDIESRSGRPDPAWRIEDRGSERVADVFRTRREAKQMAWLLENGVTFVDPTAPLCWRIYRDI